MTAKVRAAYYGRVSTADQVDGTSLDTQRERCIDEIKRRDWVFAGEYVDEGVSGAKASRPQLDRLLAACRSGDVQAVVITKMDRLGRSNNNLSTLLDELDRLKVTLISVTQAIDSTTASGRMFRNMLSAWAEFDRDTIRERTLEGKLAVVKAGGWWGGPAPYGYKLVQQTDGKHKELAIDEREADMLRLAVGIILDEQGSTGDAAKVLNAMGYLPRTASEWTYHSLRRVLREARLTGDWAFGRPNTYQRGESDGQFQIKVEPIISQERCDALRAVLNLSSTGPSSEYLGFYMLSKGVLISPCGANMWGKQRRDRNTRSYFCSNTLCNTPQLSTPPKCDCKGIPADVIEGRVWSEVENLLSDPARLMGLAAEFLEHRGEQMSSEKESLGTLQRKIEQLDKARTQEATAALKAGLDPELLKSAIGEIDGELSTLRRRATQLRAWRNDNAGTTKRLQRLIELSEQAHLRLADLSPEEKRIILDVLEVRVQVLGWEPCQHCEGRGKVKGGRGGTSCPVCRMIKSVPRLRIEGTWTSALIEQYGEEEYAHVGRGENGGSPP
jgi:site-specific DNA recombinase